MAAARLIPHSRVCIGANLGGGGTRWKGPAANLGEELGGRTGIDTSLAWTVETWGGHPRSLVLPRELPLGLHQAALREPALRNLARWENPELDRIIEANRTVAFDDPKVVELGMDYLKLAVTDMPFIALMAYNKFAPFDETYWTGYPSIENAYAASGPFWSNLRYMVVALKANRTRCSDGAGGSPARYSIALPNAVLPPDPERAAALIRDRAGANAGVAERG